ncbi:MAG: hypothetical protein ACOYNN_19050, partial [Terrimicrobiaceae bacterium]
MSTKTTFKRIALVTVAALGFGGLVSVAPAQAAVSTTLNAVVGPNGATSLTVIGSDSATVGAVVRLDVTNDETATNGYGLRQGETITATVVGVPTTVTAKTVAINGGSMVDTSTVAGGGSGRSDFTIIETTNSASGVLGATAAESTSKNTDWSLLPGTLASTTNVDEKAAGATFSPADAKIDAANTKYVNKDTFHNITTGVYTTHYYATIMARPGSNVIDQGAYTFQFQLTDASGIVRSTKTVKIDFVSSAAKSDAVLTLTPTGTFIAGAVLNGYDSATANAYASLTLRNRDGGLVRMANGSAPSPVVKTQISTTAAPGYVDSPTAAYTVSDSGVAGTDFGTGLATSPGNGTLQAQDGVYGINGAIPAVATATGTAYRWWAGFGNATLLTPALTIFATSGSGTGDAARTDSLVTAAGMSAADNLVKSNSATPSWTLPLTAKTATVKFSITTTLDTPTPAADITVTPTWTGTHTFSGVSTDI